MDSAYKAEDVNAAPIRVIQLLYNSGVSVRNIWILSELFLSLSQYIYRPEGVNFSIRSRMRRKCKEKDEISFSPSQSIQRAYQTKLAFR